MPDKRNRSVRNVADDADWDRICSILPVSDPDASARMAKALVRARQVRCARDLLRLVFAYVLKDLSLTAVVVWAASALLCVLSAVALRKRLRGCLPWLGLLIGGLLLQQRHHDPPQTVHVRLIDASVITAPGSSGTDWRLHLDLDLQRGRLDGIEVTDAHGGETLMRHQTGSGCISIVDRGYAHRRGVGHLLAGGGWLVLRINWQNLPLQSGSGQAIDIVSWLTTLPAEETGECLAMVVTPQGTFGVRLIAQRLNEQATERARRRLHAAARKKGRQPDARSLAAAAFIYVVSNVPQRMCTAEDILNLYRLRWQVEIHIKRLKGIWHVDHLRTKDPILSQLYLCGTLLAALLAEAMTGMLPECYADWFTSTERPLSLWQLSQFWQTAFQQAVYAGVSLADILDGKVALSDHIRDSPRKRAQQAAYGRARVRDLQLLS
jgi:hypothetical protein